MTMVILQVFYSVFSALITALSIPNEILKFGSPLLGMIALIPLFIAVHNSHSFRMAGHLVALQIFLTHLLSSYWLGKFKDFAIFTLGASGLAYYFFGYVFGNYLYTVFYYTELKNPLKKFSATNFMSPFYQILGFASIWTIYEWFKSTGWLAYPWGTLFMSMYKWHTLKQICAITGTLGLTYLLSLFSATIAKGILLLPDVKKFRADDISLKSYRITAIYCMTLFIIGCAFGVHEYKVGFPVEKTLNVAIIQHNGDSWMPNSNTNIKNSMEETDKALQDFASKGEKCDLVVWNESTVAGFGLFPEAYELLLKRFPPKAPFYEYVHELKTPLLVGAPAHTSGDKENALNSAIYFDENGEIVDFYSKIHLVPFAEEIPYSDTKFVQKMMKKIVGFSNGWTPGKSYKVFEVANSDGEIIKFTTPICFEDAFPDLCRDLYNCGSQIFVNITNDSWSMTDSAEYQHFVVSSFRTIEHRTSMIRACVSGFSVVINANGDIIEGLPLFEKGHLSAEVPIYQRSNTIFSIYGNWIMAVIFVFMVLFIIMIFVKTIREERALQIAIQEVYENEQESDEEI